VTGGTTALRFLRRTGAVCALLAALSMLAAPAAGAHPYLVATSPQAGVLALGQPTSIQLSFTEAVTLSGCSITVRNQRGRPVHTGPLRAIDGGYGLSVATPKLAEGIYSVSWVAYGDDGHTVSGSFRFGVPGPHGQVPSGAGTLLASTSANGSESAPIESPVSLVGRWLAAIGGFFMLGGAILLVRLRGRVEPSLRSAASARWRQLALGALALAALGTALEAIERLHGPGGFSLSLLTGSSSGVAVLVRAGALALCGLGLAILPSRRRPAVLGVAGALVLGALAIDGHVATVRHAPALAAVGQIAHLLGAGLWVGGVIVLAVCVAPLAVARGRPGELLAAARAFTMIALPAAIVTCATGLLAAIRETRNFYFLRWSSYGHLVIAKVALVAIVLALGGASTLLARRVLAHGQRPGGIWGRRLGWLMRGEAFAAVGAAAVASLLAGTLQGRGQPLPSQRGNLLPGAGYADVGAAGAIAQLTLAPARAGENRIVAAFATPADSNTPPPVPPHQVSVSLRCACAGRRQVVARLHPGADGARAWFAPVDIPRDGTWYAQLEIDGRQTIGSPTFTVGAPGAPGAPPVIVASVADLSGPDALDCRSQELGALYAIELMNLVGGLDGRKIDQLLLDDGGSPALARSEALALARRHPVAFLAPCGQGASAAIQAIGGRVPTIVADDNVPPTPGPMVYRLAPAPYAEGYAAGQYIAKIGLPFVAASTPRRVLAFVRPTADSQQRLAGLKAALAPSGVSVSSDPASGPALERRLLHAIPSSSSLGIYLDGSFWPLADALARVGQQLPASEEPTAVLTSQRLASEQFVVDSGELGALGAIHVVSDVDPASLGAQTYTTLASQVVGEQPTMPGLSGFVAGQALAYGLAHGSSAQAIAARLREPAVFSRAALSPWSARAPWTGTLIFQVFSPIFLTANLLPTPTKANGGAPGEVESGQFFADGDWEPGSGTAFSPLPLNLTPKAPQVNRFAPYVPPPRSRAGASGPVRANPSKQRSTR
jgi:methionine-rich copper-binding protein CopC/putative copper export protein/ABC-type branched-subunit amino acid transport system substrate-binding protein